MPRFEPFRGVRFASALDLQELATPPWDVIDAAERAELAARSPYNMVHVDLPEGRYDEAATLLTSWQRDGVLVTDDRPTLTIYRMTFTDEGGREQHSTGVLGALELMRPGSGDVLPHERITPKASDRLALLRATHANLSPIWGMSMASGLGAACEPDGAPDAAVIDAEGVRHEAWVVRDPQRVARLAALVSSAVVVIADGHHRYATSLQFHEEQAEAGAPGPHDLTLAFVVELSPEQLHVRAIHRLLDGLADPAALVSGALAASFAVRPAASSGGGAALLAEMDASGALAVLVPGRPPTLLVPRADAFAGVADLDSARLDHALGTAGLTPTLRFQHGIDKVEAALGAGEAQAAVLLRPVPVATIEQMARDRAFMPPKSTFFVPKPRTGFVLRRLDA